MPKFKNPVTNKFIEITEEEDDQCRELCKTQAGLMFYQAYNIIKDQAVKESLRFYV